MEKIIVQTGAKTYQIADQDGNDLGVFRFIPSDAGILKRYKEAAAFFTGINDKIKDKDFEEILPDLEKEAGEKIDLLFGAPVSESFFKIMQQALIRPRRMRKRHQSRQKTIFRRWTRCIKFQPVEALVQMISVDTKHLHRQRCLKRFRL